ncbi:hypothetical protein ACA910_021905 [Epithemia clementina (nom. ined.)]
MKTSTPKTKEKKELDVPPLQPRRRTYVKFHDLDNKSDDDDHPIMVRKSRAKVLSTIDDNNQTTNKFEFLKDDAEQSKWEEDKETIPEAHWDIERLYCYGEENNKPNEMP